jgi:hypothetical protein
MFFCFSVMILSCSAHSFIKKIPLLNNLSVVVSPFSVFKEDSMMLKIEFKNNGVDTLLLPIEFLSDRNCIELKFLDLPSNIEKPCCGQVSKYDFSNFSGKCDDIRLLIIPPKQSRYVDFNIEEELSYIGFVKNQKYKFQIILHINTDFSIICNKLWTGSILSIVSEFQVY